MNGMTNKSLTLAVLATLFGSSLSQFNLHAEEGELIITRDKCYVVLADGSEEETQCPSFESPLLTEDQKREIVGKLRSFEVSEDDKRFKKMSSGLTNIESQSDGNASTRFRRRPQFTEDELRTAAKIKKNKYVVRLIFPNTKEYPQKSSRHQNYFVSDPVTGFEQKGSTFASQWDEIIATQTIGVNYAQFQTEVIGVTRKNVIIDLLVEDSTQLATILIDKELRSIDHVGMPLPAFEEIAPKTFTTTK